MRQLFGEAMKDGHVLLRTHILLLMGVAGSGKSSVKDLLLDNPPKEKRNSTLCRNRTLHVRPVTNHFFQSTVQKWEEVSQKDLVNVLGQAIRCLPRNAIEELSSNLQSRLKPSITDSSDSTTSLLSPSYQAITTVVELVQEAILAAYDSEQTPVAKTNELFGTRTLRVTDNGGQPQFHDIASLFIRYASAGLFVMRLTDDFDDYPLDDLYKDGELIGTPSPSHLSHGETITSLLQSFLSFGQNPRFIFIGTFLDEIEKMKDFKVVLSEKNKRILEMLPPELRKQVVYSSHRLDEVLFALNACSRDADTKTVAEEIRKAVEGSPAIDFEVPLWWFIIELSLQKLSSILKRGVLKKAECIELADFLGFHPDALEAALVYFDEMCIVHYYPEILPDIVFVDPQVPLDKVSELTQQAISLRKAKVSESSTDKTFTAVDPEWLRFRDEGVLTTRLLDSKMFLKHFKEGLFTPTDLIAILKELLVIAPLAVTSTDKVDRPLSQMEFFMPTLLKSIPPSELERHRVFNSSADPLLIRFQKGCIQCGVFCCLVVFLMKEYKWQVCLPSGEPVLLARNCVKFRLPNDPGIITLIDSFSFIEVHIRAFPRICERVCPIVRKNILEGVNAASKNLHYEHTNNKPIPTFFCPHEDESVLPNRHYAEIYPDSGVWCCSRNIELVANLKPSHTVWFDSHKKGNDFARRDYSSF